MKQTLILIDNLNYLSQKLNIMDHQPITVFWNSKFVDVKSIKLLARSVEEIYASPTILGEASTILGRKISLLEGGKSIQLEKKLQTDRPIAFFVANDTIAKMLVNIAKILELPSFFILPNSKNENALDVIASENLPFIINKPGLLALKIPSVLVMGNDWGDEERQLIKSATRLNIPSVCIQDGDLQWEFEMKPMQWATFSFLQGPIAIKYLPRTVYFLTGNPRFDSLSQIPLPAETVVMINSNFAYGILDDKRDEWIDDIVSACNRVGHDFFISQHPREMKKIVKYPVKKSNASVIYSQIFECSILVSRFSTVISEAILMGRQAIYYNPHGETMQLFNDDNTNGIYKAYSRDELLKIFESIKCVGGKNQIDRNNFTLMHCGCNDGFASQRCANSIQEIKRWSDGFSKASFFLRFFYLTSEKIENIYAIIHSVVRNFFKSIKSIIPLPIRSAVKNFFKSRNSL